MGLPSIMFINFNISVLVPIYPSLGSFTIPFLHGLFSTSGGILLIMKLLYIHFNIQLDQMLYVYALGTIIMHIQTIFFTPKKQVPKNISGINYSVYSESIVGSFFRKDAQFDADLAKRRVCSL